jgi:Gpi18-like mannosyltransferase
MTRRLWFDALLAFALSRAVFFALVIAGSQIAFLQKTFSNSVWETRIDFQAARVRPELERVAMVGDAWFYRAIAMEDYDRSERDAFFPLYPLLVRTLGNDFPLNGLIVSNIAFLCSLFLLGALAMRSGASAEDAGRAMFYLAFFPTSYFLSLPVTEALFLALTLASVLGAMQGRWWAAGIFGGLATATRLAGVLLIPLLLIIFLQRNDRPRARLAWIAVVPAGMLAFMAHLYRVTGDAFAFMHVQARWGRTFSWRSLVAQLGHLAEPWNFVALNAAVAALLLLVATHLLLRREFAFGVYTLCSALLPLSTGSFQSIARYAVVVFPLFLWLAVRGRRPGWDRVILAVSIALFGWLTALLTLRVDFALA